MHGHTGSEFTGEIFHMDTATGELQVDTEKYQMPSDADLSRMWVESEDVELNVGTNHFGERVFTEKVGWPYEKGVRAAQCGERLGDELFVDNSASSGAVVDEEFVRAVEEM